MSFNLVLLIIAAILSLPGGLFMAFIMSEPRARALSLVGGVIGAALVAAGIYYFINASKVSIDGLSYGLGSFFACSMGVFAGALLVNFLTGLSGRSRDMTTVEY